MSSYRVDETCTIEDEMKTVSVANVKIEQNEINGQYGELNDSKPDFHFNLALIKGESSSNNSGFSPVKIELQDEEGCSSEIEGIINEKCKPVTKYKDEDDELKESSLCEPNNFTNVSSIEFCYENSEFSKNSQGLTCDRCNETFTKKIEYSSHIMCPCTIDSPQCNDEFPYSCSECQKTFTNLNDLTKHRDKHTDDEKNFINKFTGRGNSHKHTSVRPFSCDICKRDFERKEHLKKHNNRVHSDKKQFFSCDKCNRNFSHKCDIRRHVKIHSGERPYPCNFCDKSFIRNEHLQMHIRCHTGERNYLCDVCNKSFNQRGGLKQHMRIHTGERPFSCSICDKSFSFLQNFKDHLRIHTGERPFICDSCNQCFARKGHLNQHLRRHSRCTVITK